MHILLKMQAVRPKTHRVVNQRNLRTNIPMATLETLRFDNLALRRLPIDREERNFVRTVADACFSKVRPTPVDRPVTVAYSANAMALLDLDVSQLERSEFAEYFSGNRLLRGSDPAAHCYCGHQFGSFVGQLGDGAAMYLGEIINSRNERWELQLKGAGLTPYSRTADGRKVLRSSIREFLCSEAMYYLNIPTTRAGSCVTSKTEVSRDVFYNGERINERCTIVSRIAPTFLRFGSFEIFKTVDPESGRFGPSVGKIDMLINMLDYTIETFFPEIHQRFPENRQEKYSKFFEAVVRRTAYLIAEWQSVGFCHGVLNTDNMSIIGLTIDYGPFAFMDMYNPDHTCNASDQIGRYTYAKQPEIGLWNLEKLAETINLALPLSESVKSLQLYELEYSAHFLIQMRKKLGLLKEFPEDNDLVLDLLSTMENTGADFTNTFRSLSSLLVPGLEGHEASLESLKRFIVEKCCYPVDIIADNIRRHITPRQKLLFFMGNGQPEMQQIIETNIGADYQKVNEKFQRANRLTGLSEILKKAESYGLWAQWICKYCHRLLKEYHGHDERAIAEYNAKRVDTMNQTNPRFILRNHILQIAIQRAEAGDFSEVEKLLKILEKPYDESSVYEPFSELPIPSSYASTSGYSRNHSMRNQGGRSGVQGPPVDDLPPRWAFDLKVS